MGFNSGCKGLTIYGSFAGVTNLVRSLTRENRKASRKSGAGLNVYSVWLRNVVWKHLLRH